MGWTTSADSGFQGSRRLVAPGHVPPSLSFSFASGTPSASPGPRLTRARLGDGRPLPSSGGRACGRREWDRPQTRRASARRVQAKAARSQWGPRGQGTPRSGFSQRVLLPGRTPAARSAPIPDWKSGSPALEPPRIPCRMTGTAPTVPQVPESRRRRFQGDGNDACSAKRSPSVPATFTQVSAHGGGWHRAVNHAQTCQPGGVAPSRQSRVDVPDQPVWVPGVGTRVVARRPLEQEGDSEE